MLVELCLAGVVDQNTSSSRLREEAEEEEEKCLRFQGGGGGGGAGRVVVVVTHCAAGKEQLQIRHREAKKQLLLIARRRFFFQSTTITPRCYQRPFSLSPDSLPSFLSLLSLWIRGPVSSHPFAALEMGPHISTPVFMGHFFLGTHPCTELYNNCTAAGHWEE